MATTTAPALPDTRGGRPPRVRLAGIDVARSLALIGMAAAHLVPRLRPDGTEVQWASIVSGRPAALFALLAGVGLALATRGARRPDGTRGAPGGRELWAARAGVAARAALLLAIGLWLGGIDSVPLVILAYYAVLFLAAIPLLGLGARTLAALAALWCVLSPVASQLLRMRIEDPLRGTDLQVGQPVDVVALELLLTGTYPAFTWLTYLLAGLAVGRLDLSRLRVAAWLAAGGAALATVAWGLSRLLLGPLGGLDALSGGDAARADRLETTLMFGLPGTTPVEQWWWLAGMAPHSGSPFDLAHTTGVALAVLGCCLLITRAGWVTTALFPLAAAGSMTLSLYTAHVVALDGRPSGGDWAAVLATQVAVALVVATGWRLLAGRGPLETIAYWLDRGARRLVTGPARPAAPPMDQGHPARR